MQLAQIQSIRADQDKSSIGYRISFIQTLIAVDHNRASLSEQDFERSKLELEALRQQVENKKGEIGRSKDEMKRQIEYLNGLNKEFDNELMARVMLEVELQTFREELIFMKAIYEEERNELALLGTYQIDVGQFYRDELARAVANIKKDFEILSDARSVELKEYYRIKIEQVETEIADQKLKKPALVHTVDLKTIRGDLGELRNSYGVLQSENAKLATQMRDLEEEFERIRFDRSQSQMSLEQEFAMRLAEYNALQAAISGVHENNVSLQFEINTYRRLLE
ncbi:unnamed protein product, partial [Rotaria sp. Silwood2]